MKNMNHLFSGLLALSLGLAACNSGQNTPAPATLEPTTPRPTAIPATVTPAPSAIPTDVVTPTSVAGSDSGFACSVAYSAGSRVFCPGEGGTVIAIADAGDKGGIGRVAISSDGAWVAYLVNLNNENSELWAVNVSAFNGVDGFVHKMLVSNAQVPNADPSIINSPDRFAWQAGTPTLFFDTRYIPAGGIQGPGEYINNDLWRVDVNSGEVANVLPQNSSGVFTLSPNGQHIAVSGPTAIQLLNADGSNRRTVVEYPSIITYSEYQYKPTVVWSPDSAFFSTVVPSSDPLAADASATVYRVNANENVAQTISVFSGNYVFGGSLPPGISPDGQRLVSSVSVDGRSDLRLTNADGSNPMVFASTGLSINVWGWAPDSQHYAYGIVPEGGNFVLQANGALEPFGEGITPVALEWVSASQFYMIGVTGNAQYALYIHALGQTTQLLVAGLTPGSTLDVRN